MEQREYLSSPSDLYLEGSDQHRGWFHSSLLCSAGTRGVAPYKSVLTHGFVVDGKGKAMHKSAGNVIATETMIKKYGAEILRLWVAGEDYRDNIRVSEEIMTRLTEAYRRIRNTCRFLLGNLDGFDPEKDIVPYAEMFEIDKWALHKLQDMNERVLKGYESFEFHIIYHTLHNFCVLDLSSFYLDIIKDRLYVSPPGSIARRSAQTAMQEILDVMVRLMAPILSFTADEIWQYRSRSDKFTSVHTSQFIPVKEEYRDRGLNERWEKIIRLRKEVTKALEIARRDKLIGHSLDATVTLELPDEYTEFLVPYMNDLSSIFIVSSVKTGNTESDGCYASDEIQGLRVKVEPSADVKCERCWVHDPTVGKYHDHPCICERCYDALKQMGLK